jgi:nucleoside-diphosphate-sugar epimerase
MGSQVRIGITGASGYLGSELVAELTRFGYQVKRLVREPNESDIQFILGNPIDPESIQELDFLIHAAYDFSAKGKRITEVNQEGSQHLIWACQKNSVPIIFISSLSAFQNTKSRYGRVKLSLERQISDNDWWSVRCGLIAARKPGGILGQIVSFVKGAKFVPIVGGTEQKYRLSHIDDIVTGIIEIMENRPKSGVYLFASQQEVSMNVVASDVSRELNRSPILFSVPSRVAFIVMKLLEQFRFFPFRSDSVLSTMGTIDTLELDSLLRTSNEFIPWSPIQAKLLVSSFKDANLF